MGEMGHISGEESIFHAYLQTLPERCVQGTFSEHSGNIWGTFREHLGNIQGTFGEHSEIQGTFRRSHVSGEESIFHAYLQTLPERCVQGTFGEHSVNIQGTFREHSVNF
jgi:hypothetical protein